jgi:hypothetical protein
MVLSFGPLSVPAGVNDPPFQRADLKFIGIDHSWSSFEARVFLNAADASASTATDAALGYAGSFYIFGHGGCFGDEGHCEVPASKASMFDRRRPHQLIPTTKLLVITDMLRALLGQAQDQLALTITVIPVVRASVLAAPEDADSVLRVEAVTLLTYD